VRRRLVGAALRRYRENVGYALEDAARILECDRSKISRVETGQRGIRPKELRELLAEYGVPRPEQCALVDIAHRGTERGWWDQYADVVPETAVDYLIVESVAAEIMIYEAQLVPDLLQTPGYARAVAEAGLVAGQQLEDTVAAKAARQDCTLTAGKQLVAILGEAALRQEVGGAEVMAGQIAHLAELSGDMPNVTIQVLPFSAGAHAAAGSGSLAILRFQDAPSLGLVYLEALSGGVYLDAQSDVADYNRAFAMLRASALSGAATRDLLLSMERSSGG
jgi:transcriptional regulator with XRE-family HTH domain